MRLTFRVGSCPTMVMTVTHSWFHPSVCIYVEASVFLMSDKEGSTLKGLGRVDPIPASCSEPSHYLHKLTDHWLTFEYKALPPADHCKHTNQMLYRCSFQRALCP
jgi:hypothetical protein